MKIERNLLSEQRIEDFADENGLTMFVGERDSTGHNRFYAYFKEAEVKQGYCLVSVYGDGLTEVEAIQQYAGKISRQMLVLHAYTSDRHEILAPKLHYSPTESA